jgi:hypothetical protein
MLDFSGYLERAPPVYIPVLSPCPEPSFAAQDCRAIISRDFIPVKPTQQETALRMGVPSISHLHPPSHTLIPPHLLNRI